MTASGDVLQVYEDLFRVEYACITFTKGRSCGERNDYIIYKFSRAISLLCFIFLKKLGVSPVTFLNWFDRWATLL